MTKLGASVFVQCENLQSIYFSGNAPSTDHSLLFWSGNLPTVTAYYPAGNPTWTEEERAAYGEYVVWVSYDPDQTGGDEPEEPTVPE